MVLIGELPGKHDVAVQNGIIANLESSLVQKTSEYNQLLSFMAPDAIEVERINKQIQELKAAITKAKTKLSGQKKGPCLVFPVE